MDLTRGVIIIDLYANVRYKSTMGVPAKLTERQLKFAELLVYNEGRKSPAECASESGYKSRPRQAASELRNPKYSPLVVKYIGELRAEVQEKYGINFERHITELAKIREDALKKGAWSAAVNAEVARGKAAGIYVDRRETTNLNVELDRMSYEDLIEKMSEFVNQKTSKNVTPVAESVESKATKAPDTDSIKQSL